MRKILVVIVLAFAAVAAHASTEAPETWTVGGKSFTTKAAAVRFIIAAGKPLTVVHSRCEILTNKLSFKACPKNKGTAFDNQQFQSLSVQE